MFSRPDVLPADVLRSLAARQRARARGHLRTAVTGFAGTVTVAGLLAAALHDGDFVTRHPGSLALDAAFVALLLVLGVSALTDAALAWRAGRLASAGGDGTPCSVQRLPAATGLRAGYLLVRRPDGGAPVLVRCSRDAGLARLPERGEGVLLARGRFGPVVIGTPDRPPLVGRAGRYERLLPRGQRADFIRTTPVPRRPETD